MCRIQRRGGPDSGTRSEPLAEARPLDPVPQTFVLVRHPVPGACASVKVDFGASAISTGRPEPVSVGRHRFDLDVDDKRYGADEVCPAGCRSDNPFPITLVKQ